jgi:hypothetical protein
MRLLVFVWKYKERLAMAFRRHDFLATNYTNEHE